MREIFRRIDVGKLITGILIAVGGTLFYCIFSGQLSLKGWIASINYYVSPMITGLIVAYALRPFVKFFENRLFRKLKSQRWRIRLGTILTLVLVVIAVYFFSVTLIPQFVGSLTTLASNLDGYMRSLRELIMTYAEKIDFIDINVDKLAVTSDEVLLTMTNWLSENAQHVVGFFYQLGNQVVSSVIVFAIAIYALLDRMNLKRGLIKIERAIIGDNRSEYINGILKRADTLMMKFLGSNLLDSLIIGCANFIFMSIFQMPYAILASVIVGVTNYIPTFGPFIGAGLSAPIVLLASPNMFVWYLLWILIIQQIDGNVIKPLLFGDSTGMSPFWVLVSIVVGGRVFGVMGMILGVPMFALVSSLVKEIVNKKLAKRASEAQGVQPPKPDKEDAA